MASSSASSTCRIEWRPSAWLVAGLAVMGALAAIAVLSSAMPAPASPLVAALALAEGLRLAWREWRRAPRRLLLSAGRAWLAQDGVAPVALSAHRWQVRGRFAWLQGRDVRGRTHWLAWGPDTLDPGALRELQLARGANASTVPHPLVAP